MIRVQKLQLGSGERKEQLKLSTGYCFYGAAAIGTDGKLYDGYSPEARLKKFPFFSCKGLCTTDSSRLIHMI